PGRHAHGDDVLLERPPVTGSPSTPGGRGGPRTILIAPDSFKGSLTSVQVARALADGWLQARPADEVLLSPLADGGEGTLLAMETAGGWQRRNATARDPLGRQITARWLISDDGSRAAIEMAAASGLSLLNTNERDPIRATSIGTGDLIRTALNAGVTSIVLGIGGSATTDGGAGLLTGLGATADRDSATVDLSGLDERLGTVELQVASDVTNPLCGPTGAAAVYGPQKGATPEQVQDLDGRLDRFANTVDVEAGRPNRDTPGAGAAGGVGYALLSIQDRFRAFGLRSGVDLVMDATDFDARLARADLVITGEGRIDSQTAFGKTALGVARRAQAAGVPCIAVGGGVEPEGIAALAAVGAIAVPVVERPQSVQEAMAAGVEPLIRCGERLARLVATLA
ncbi:MAG: glycerate 2-kinase, partial [Chloroflexota bacterium]|nr:glycerate 2-kinase [Chloroflexota bacterium]